MLKINNMKKYLILLHLCFCSLFNSQTKKNYNGIYAVKDSGQKIELTSNGFYTLYNPDYFGELATDFCEYSSKGKWKQISSDVIDLTSENYYLKQDGYKYNLEQGSRLSQDSIYINITFPKDFENNFKPEYDIIFNYNTSKRIKTTNSKIKLSKKDYSLIDLKNQITLGLNFIAKGEQFFNNRLAYSILKNFPLDVDKFNYYTISLNDFNKCFFDFEPYYHSYIFIKNEKTLVWKGEEWIKN